MAWDFHVGQRVVYTGPTEDHYIDPDAVLPALGSIHTIAEIRLFPTGSGIYCGSRLIVLGMDLISFRLTDFQPSEWWGSPLFRPLDERRLDQFRAHLAPKDPEPAVRRPDRERA